MRTIIAALLFILLPLTAHAQCVINEQALNYHYDQHVDYSNPNIPTDFFMLMYSNSPQFCQKHGKSSQYNFQCHSENAFGWVIHGLWGDSTAAYLSGDIRQHPRFCRGDLPKVPLATLKPYLCMSPGTALLQGEWEKHGACDFPSARAYYQQEQQLYQRFKVAPGQLNSAQAVRWMKRHNPVLADKRLHRQGSEFGICFNRQFAVISCPKRRK
ncbi:ribonuclease T2 family protein [Celerinatantimonas yamalensis]|uniref:Ribonuclease n=1 Tax=Celerinatantimonas yamalensis TaxID=559956 RepID=A0ABW9G252_9GAMM